MGSGGAGAAAFGALKYMFDTGPEGLEQEGQPFNREIKSFFYTKHLSAELRGEVYKALVLPNSLYGFEAWSLREELLKTLQRFFVRNARSMCRVNFHHTLENALTSKGISKEFEEWVAFVKDSGRSEDSRLTPIPDHRTPDCQRKSEE